MGLSLNEAKTCIRNARKESFDFLGYTFGPTIRRDGQRYLAARPSKKSIARVKQHIRERLWRGNPAPWEEVAKSLNCLLRGWAGYFSYGTRHTAYKAIDRHVTLRVRTFLRRRHKVPTRGARRFGRETIQERFGIVSLRALSVAAQP